MTEFSLDILLKAIKLARSTYYYHLKQLDKPDKDQELKAEIQSIFIEHKGNYAYRRIYLELRNRGYLFYQLLKRHGWRNITPRPEHPKKADAQTIVASKNKISIQEDKKAF
ncbi:IS3-Spn1 transposase [Streptococcus pneumoniae]|nr:IS3-Spn1 transposase [Streptococcus pneumoniae]